MAATSALIHHRNQDSSLVYLNIYDVATDVNPIFLRLGLGPTLSCVQVHGHEHMFGGQQHLLRSQGGPRLRRPILICLRRSILIGRTELDQVQVRETIRRLKSEYTADSYDPFTNNCHHFSDRLCQELTGGNGIPWWVNRIATFGVFRCCLPLPLPGADHHQPSIAAADDNGDADDDTDGTRNDHEDNGDDHEEHHDDGDHNTDDDGDEEPAYLEILQRKMRAMSRPTATQEEAPAAPAPAATSAAAVPSNGGFWSSLIYQLSLRF